MYYVHTFIFDNYVTIMSLSPFILIVNAAICYVRGLSNEFVITRITIVQYKNYFPCMFSMYANTYILYKQIHVFHMQIHVSLTYSLMCL